MADLVSCPLLVLDDFGNEPKPEFVFTNITYPLLIERAKNRLITAFSSDFSISALYDAYAVTIGNARAQQLCELIMTMAKKDYDITSSWGK